MFIMECSVCRNRLSNELDDASTRCKLVASMCPADFRLSFSANRAHNFSTCNRTGSVANFIYALTDWWTTTLDVKSGFWRSMSVIWLTYNYWFGRIILCLWSIFNSDSIKKRLFRLNTICYLADNEVYLQCWRNVEDWQLINLQNEVSSE